jgi:hypothetical protein
MGLESKFLCLTTGLLENKGQFSQLLHLCNLTWKAHHEVILKTKQHN